MSRRIKLGRGLLEITPSIEMHNYYKRCSIKDLAKALVDKLAGYYISHSITEYLKDVSLITKKGNINKNGKHFIHFYYASELKCRIRLCKPDSIFEYQRN